MFKNILKLLVTSKKFEIHFENFFWKKNKRNIEHR